MLNSKDRRNENWFHFLKYEIACNYWGRFEVHILLVSVDSIYTSRNLILNVETIRWYFLCNSGKSIEFRAKLHISFVFLISKSHAFTPKIKTGLSSLEEKELDEIGFSNLNKFSNELFAFQQIQFFITIWAIRKATIVQWKTNFTQHRFIGQRKTTKPRFVTQVTLETQKTSLFTAIPKGNLNSLLFTSSTISFEPLLHRNSTRSLVKLLKFSITNETFARKTFSTTSTVTVNI